jgi:hypothetical protein
VVEFTPWPKTRRLFRDIIVSEKIDGTNAAIHIQLRGPAVSDMVLDAYPYPPGNYVVAGEVWEVTAQSRNRLIFPGNDNYGFAAWVAENAADLIELLGPGLHFGEWWGRGIQRGYGLTERRFSLFNTDKHADVQDVADGVTVEAVPVLYRGPFSEDAIRRVLTELRDHGSWAAPGFERPEGVCVWHSQTRQVSKVTLDNQDAGKWESAR